MLGLLKEVLIIVDDFKDLANNHKLSTKYNTVTGSDRAFDVNVCLWELIANGQLFNQRYFHPCDDIEVIQNVYRFGAPKPTLCEFRTGTYLPKLAPHRGKHPSAGPTLSCHTWGCNKWGFKGCLPSLSGNRPFSPFFCLFCPFPESPNSTWEFQNTEEKDLSPHISSDLLESPSLKPPFAALQLLATEGANSGRFGARSWRDFSWKCRNKPSSATSRHVSLPLKHLQGTSSTLAKSPSLPGGDRAFTSIRPTLVSYFKTKGLLF